MKKVLKHITIILIVLCLPFLAFARGDKEGGVEAGAATGEPQHGGTFSQWLDVEPKSWDQWDAYGAMCQLHALHLGQLLCSDIEKYGPRGSNDFPFTLTEHQPDAYLGGQLAESWELTTNPLGVKFKIRKGVKWVGNDRIGMKPRDYTAHDAAAFLNRFPDLLLMTHMADIELHSTHMQAYILSEKTIQRPIDKVAALHFLRCKAPHRLGNKALER